VPTYELSGQDIARLEHALRVLATIPESPDAWAAGACVVVRDLVGGDYSLYTRQLGKSMTTLSLDTSPAVRLAVEAMIPVMTKAAPPDPDVARLIQLERAGVFDAYTAASLDALLDGGFSTSPFVRTVMAPAGMRDLAGLTVLRRDGGGVARIAVGFRRPGGAGGERALTLLRLVRPVFEAGAALADRFARSADTLLVGFDLAGEGALLLRRDGKRLHQNAAMTRLLAEEPERAVVEASALRGGAVALGVAHRRGAVEPGHLEAFAATVCTRRARYTIRSGVMPSGGLLPDGCVLVVVRRGSLAPDTAEVARRLRLPRRVAEVAVLLAQRATNGEVAAALGISPHTARRHTERVLARLGVPSRTGVSHALAAALDMAESS
jgi:DNA-binding CsgD family transcriptional regulator